MQEGDQPVPDGAITTGTRSPIPFRTTPPSTDQPPVCRFLAREAPDGTLGPPGTAVDPSHRCVALIDPLPQSARQQELVCLTGAHTSCPRYLRGMLLLDAPPTAQKREPVSTAVIGAALIFLAAIAASFAFLAVRGGFEFAAATTPTPSLVAVVPFPSASSAAIASPIVSAASSPSAGLSAAPSESPAPAPTATPVATPAPTATPVPTAAPTRTPTPAPTSDRFALLTKCPGTSDCWIYEIRSGDNLVSIAHYFGVDYDRMRAMNPNLQVPIQAGEKLRIPTPTR